MIKYTNYQYNMINKILYLFIKFFKLVEIYNFNKICFEDLY